MDTRKKNTSSKAISVRRATPFEKPGDLVGPALSLIPYVGGTLSSTWSQWDTNQRFARIDSFLKEFAQQIEALGNRFDPHNIGDDEMRFLEEAAKRIASEHREMKRKRFASLVLSTWTKRRECPFEENMAFIRALDEFEEIHIGILMFLKNAGDKFPSFTDIGEALGVLVEDRDNVLVPALDRLASGYRFIRRACGMSNKEGVKVLSSKNLSPEGIAKKCEHAITKFGISFLDSVEQGQM